ncbi:hypothetical protein, partial [Victivallis vadensis]|uniref:hypothetical protein n=1 Tax=Victivallis vadensis TaxID=172901 RepID=UPI003D01A9F1
MADSAASVLENFRKGVFPLRFSSGTTFLRNTTVSGGTECQTGSRSTRGITPPLSDHAGVGIGSGADPIPGRQRTTLPYSGGIESDFS